MDVIRGSLSECWRLVDVVLGSTPEGRTARPQPRRGAVWVVVQVLALAAVLAALLAVRLLVFGGPDPAPESIGTRLAWAVPGAVLLLPLFLHWFADPPRRVPGVVAGLASGLVTGVVMALAVAGSPAPWAGFTTLTVAAVAAAAVFGAISTRPAGPTNGTSVAQCPAS